MRKTVSRRSACALVALGFSAALVFSAPAIAADNVKITIGFTAALTGDFAAFGLNMRKGLDLALQEINGKDGVTYEVVSADDRGDPNEGVLIAQKFCDDSKIDIIMGYSFSSVALAVVPIIDQCKIPVLASAVGSPQLTGASKYFRRNLLTDAVQGKLMGEYAVKVAGAKRIYVLHQQDDYGIGVADAFIKAATAAGAKILGEDNYLLGTKDFNTQVSKIRETNPDAIFIGGYYPEAAKIAEQSRDLGIKAQFLGTDGSLSPELIKLGGSAVEGMVVYGMFDPSVETPDTTAFLSAYRAKYHEDPNAWAALAYDAGNTLAEAVKIAKASGSVDRDSLNAAFFQIKNLKGVTGPTTFKESGDRDGKIYFLKVKNGKFALTNAE